MCGGCEDVWCLGLDGEVVQFLISLSDFCKWFRICGLTLAQDELCAAPLVFPR